MGSIQPDLRPLIVTRDAENLCCRLTLGLTDILLNGLRLAGGDDRGERANVGVADGLERAEVLKESPGGGFANARNVEQFGGAVADLAALAMEGHGEAVGFVTDHL